MKGKKKKNSLFRRQLPLQMFVLAGILYLFIFSYIPMFGLIMGFKNYDIVTGVKGIFTSEWVGLKYFKEFVNDFNFWKLIKNTVGISVLKMIFTFPLPIVFAIMLNEMGSYHFKKLVQTCSYLPHFVSWVIISGISFRFLSSTGIVNSFLSFIGFTKEAIPFLNSPKLYWGLAVFLDVWKEMGWWTIVFLAAISGVSQDLFEAASIDGASKWKQLLHVSLPGIAPVISIQLLLTVGKLLTVGYEKILLLYTGATYETADVISTYVYRRGLMEANYSYGSAVSIFQAVVALVLVVSANKAARKVGQTSLW